MSETSLFDLYRNDVDSPRAHHYVHFVPGGAALPLHVNEFLHAIGVPIGGTWMRRRRGQGG